MNEPIVISTLKSRRRSVATGKITTTDIHKEMSERLKLPIDVLDTIIDCYWKIIIMHVRKFDRVLVNRRISINPVFVPSYRVLKGDGKEKVIPDKIFIPIKKLNELLVLEKQMNYKYFKEQEQ